MKKQILVVAVEHDVLHSFPVTLTLAGHEVKIASRGLQAIQQARDTSPDLILLDAILPDMDGVTAMEILNRLPSTGRIPTLLLKPRLHRLMPMALQDQRTRAGINGTLSGSELLRDVASTLELCRQMDLAKWDAQWEMNREMV